MCRFWPTSVGLALMLCAIWGCTTAKVAESKAGFRSVTYSRVVEVNLGFERLFAWGRMDAGRKVAQRAAHRFCAPEKSASDVLLGPAFVNARSYYFSCLAK